MYTVNEVINTINIDDILFYNNIIQTPDKLFAIKSLSECKIYHDIPTIFKEEDINKFLEKYKGDIKNLLISLKIINLNYIL